MNKTIAIIAGAVIGFIALGYVKAHPELVAQVQGEEAVAAAVATVASTPTTTAAPTPATLPPAKEPIANTPDNPLKPVRGIKMPGNCLQSYPDLVTYVEKGAGSDPKNPGYVPDDGVVAFVCGWNDGNPAWVTQ